MKANLLTASANSGMGLGTSISFAFCSIFGKESKKLLSKQDRILKAANARLNYQFQKLGVGYELIDYRVTWSGKLAVTVSALAVQKDGAIIEERRAKTCPKCGVLITDDMLFCGECGEKLK